MLSSCNTVTTSESFKQTLILLVINIPSLLSPSFPPVLAGSVVMVSLLQSL